MNHRREIFWRSMLFVPANNARYVEKARRSSADAIIIDLEDAVLPENKAVARTIVKEVAKSIKSSRRDVLVRINRPLTMALPDIAASICKDVDGLVVAKTASIDHVSLLGEVIAEHELANGLGEGHTSILPLIETPEAVANMEKIASAPRVAAVVCGDEDLAAELECPPHSETIISIKHDLVVAAAKAGVRPLGLLGSISEFKNIELYQSFVEKSRVAGLKGTLCIHPDQVDIANKGFSPTPDEVSQAQRVIEAAEKARLAGAGAAALDGRMIDLPVLLRAQKLLTSAKHYA
jgi:citrate lyase subunit beta / citryl-CoA lyase